MDPQTTKKLTSRTTSNISDLGTNACWQTPPAVFAKLQQDFGPFNVDLCADQTNHLCPLWFGPGSAYYQDALKIDSLYADDWWEGSLVPAPTNGFGNPVYHYQFVNDYIPLMARLACLGFSSTHLLPLRTTSEWWAFLIAQQRSELAAAKILFCDKRICFYEDGHPRWNAKELAKGNYRPDSVVFDSVIVHFARDLFEADPTEFGLWQVPPHVPKALKVTL